MGVLSDGWMWEENIKQNYIQAGVRANTDDADKGM